MPPLDKYTVVSPSSVVLGVIPDKNDTFETIPWHSSSDHKHFAVCPRRALILGTNPLYDTYLDEQEKTKMKKTNSNGNRSGLDWLDQFSCLCVDSGFGQRSIRIRRSEGRQQRRVATASKSKKVVYPIVKYPGRLNNPSLVEKRRKSIKEFLTFRPVGGERNE